MAESREREAFSATAPAPLGSPDDPDLGSLCVATYLDDVIICPRDADGGKTPSARLGGDQRLLTHDGAQPDRVAAAVARCGTSAEGLPLGVQIVARPWQDATALAGAGYLEIVFGAGGLHHHWRHRVESHALWILHPARLATRPRRHSY
jgi:hypothetical protein